MQSLISVIVPCYNIEHYIENTIKSILNSTYSEIELLLINDGSTDNTSQILKKYEEIDHRVKVIHKNNGGVSSARNIGIDIARGDYIYFLDGDDTIENTLFETALKIFEKNSEIDIFSFGFDIVNEKNIQLKNYSFKKYDKKLISGREFLNLLFTKKLRQHISSFIVRKKILKENNIIFPEDVAYCEDQEVQVKLLLNSNLIYYNNKPDSHYLQRETSAMRTEQINYDALIVFRRLKPYYENKISTIQLRQNFYNYASIFFIMKWKEGLINKRDEDYFLKLNTYSECLKKTTFTFNKYGFVAYLFSKFYLIWRN